jgi:hypothetical protein
MSSSVFETTFVCLPPALPPSDQHEALRGALRENPVNAGISAVDIAEDDSLLAAADLDFASGPLELVLNSSKLWKPGRTLKILFLGGTSELQKKVREVAEQWTQYANIKFKWVIAEPSEVRIAFEKGKGNWSNVGTDCLGVSKSTATMNFGNITESSAESKIRRAVLHEFGHALGCEHEHMSPLRSFQWNEEQIYADCATPPNNWSRTKTARNVIDKLKATDVQTRRFDSESIMLYQYPAAWMVGATESPKLNTRLSKEDKSYIAHCYPAYSSDIGMFNTLQNRPWNDPDTSNDFLEHSFEHPYESVPKLALGLTWMDLDHNKDIVIAAKATDLREDGFRVVIDSSNDAHLYTGGCTWLESTDAPEDLQIGEFVAPTMRTGAGSQSRGVKIQQTVTFPVAFAGKKPPKVVAWFKALSMSKDQAWDIRTYTSHVSVRSFVLHVDVGPETLLRCAEVTWLAYAADKDRTASGTFGDAPAATRTEGSRSGAVGFAPGTFTSPPQIFTAISGLSFGTAANLRLKLSQADFSEKGFSWHLETWLDSKMYGATGAYVAFQRDVVEDTSEEVAKDGKEESAIKS